MGLQGANKSAHWDGWEMENPLKLYCIIPYIADTKVPKNKIKSMGMLTIEASNINEMKLKQTKTDKFTKELKMELKQTKADN